MPPARRQLGALMVVSGPSGVGKSTICRAAAATFDCRISISCTTRAPRPDERDGVHYHFLSDEEFHRRAIRGEFLEHAHVHDQRYGTLRSQVLDIIRAGRDVLLDIDVQGARLIADCPHPLIQRAIAGVFVLPPSMAELERRLRGRNTESPAQLALRLSAARAEIACWPRYRYLLRSGARAEDLEAFHAILCAERRRAERHLPLPPENGDAKHASRELF